MSHRYKVHYRRHPHEGPERPGMVRRVMRGLADKFGLPRKLVLAGFIVGLIFNLPLTLFVFLVALYWVDHPGKLESKLERLGDRLRGFWSDMGGKSARGPAYAGAGGSGGSDPNEEDGNFDFADLRRQFDDLERRASDMEVHVSSEEFHLHKEFDRMNKEGGD